MPDFAMIPNGSLQQNSKRVLRGGSWINNARNLRSANRNANSPDNRNHNIGLRLAGALLRLVIQRNKSNGGSINQQWFLPSVCFYNKYWRNQGPQCASRLISERLLMGRLYSGEWGIDVY